MIFAVRHGERADDTNENGEEYKLIEKRFDPHLTQHGIKQSRKTGLKLNEVIKEANPDIKGVYIISSPFLRCIMTAYNIIQTLNYPIIN